MSEKRYEKNLREKIDKLGGYCLKFWCLSVSGFPDRMVLMPGGRIWFVELKSYSKLPKKLGLQKWWHGKLKQLGFQIVIINSDDTLSYFLNTVEYGL